MCCLLPIEANKDIYNKTNSDCHHRPIVSLISLSCGNIARVPWALGQYSSHTIYDSDLRIYETQLSTRLAIFPQLREIRLTIDLDASHYLYNTGEGKRDITRKR